jgi:hypothetical protein
MLLATFPLLDGISGHYFKDCNDVLIVPQRTEDYSGVAPYALDPNNVDRLWEKSLRLPA